LIHVVLGTKAQLVKMAPILVRLRERRVPFRFIHTGQHRATMDEMLAEFGIAPPDVVLYHGPDVVSPPQMAAWAARLLGRCLTRRQEIFGADRRGIVLVHGDTLSTLLGALMGRAAGLLVGHVEAGLRSFDLLHPFPEELTRLITFRLAHVLYCPGPWAAANVAGLGKQVVDTGANTLVDSLALASRASARRDHVPAEPYAIVSLHRYENIFRRERCEALVATIEELARDRLQLFLLHPPTARQLERFGLRARLEADPRIELRPRYTYFDFAALLAGADYVVTDGGSIQEETSYLGVPCLLLRRATERREGLGGSVVLSGYDRGVVRDFARHFAEHRRPPLERQRSPSDAILDHALGLAGGSGGAAA
jgi:UDP-N-acetylglucosamine 2-epimerase (non-hydrolysing)